jgi:uncharacterized membrane protein YdfJ with MMPL/SSD domain
MNKSARLPWLLFIAFVLLAAPEGIAQKSRKSKNKSSTEKPSGKSRSEELKKINELTKKLY